MDIAAMNVRITFQKGTAGTDRYGNHINTWDDVYTCWATPVMASGNEEEAAGTTQVKERLDVILTERGLFDSREKAKAAIMAGEIYIDSINFV